MNLHDKHISMDSHTMGDDTPHEKQSITSRVHGSHYTNRDKTFIFLSSFQTNRSRSMTNEQEFDQKIFPNHDFSHQQSQQ